MKYNLYFIFVVGVVAASLPSFYQEESSTEVFLQCFPRNRMTTNELQLLSSKLTRSRLDFSVDFVKSVLKRTKIGANIFISPHSVYQALLLALFISSNKTESEIKTALRIPSNMDKLDVLRWFQIDKQFEKIRSLNGSTSYELNNVNRIFYESSLQVRECMKLVLEDELQGLDFHPDSAQAKQFIDSWVSNQTHHQINDLLGDKELGEDTKLILVNAMYFKGLWQSKFMVEDTKKEVFFISPSKNSLVPMMKQKGNFKYLVSEKLRAHVINLPYKGDDISMYILLPSMYDPNGVKYLLEKLTTDLIEEIVDPQVLITRLVELGIPKFTVEQSVSDLVPILESMGVNDLFKNSSDLSMLTGEGGITFGDAVHKAKVSVDEEGTVAAASTAIFSFRSSRPLDPIKFICNHPFMYFLYDHVSRTILFVGIYNNPSSL